MTLPPSIPAFFRWNFALSRSMSRCGISGQKYGSSEEMGVSLPSSP